MQITFNVRGLRETSEAISELRKATGRKQARDSLIVAGEITARTARSLAPVDRGYLREGIEVSTRLSSRQAAMHQKQAEVEVFIGPRSGTKGIVQEFGSVDQGPHAYLRPAWARTGRQVLARFADEIMVRVQDAVRRARKVQ